MTTLEQKLLELQDQMSCDQTKDSTGLSSETFEAGVVSKSICRSSDSCLSPSNETEKYECIAHIFNEQIKMLQTMIQNLRGEISVVMNTDNRQPKLLEQIKSVVMDSPISELTQLSLLSVCNVDSTDAGHRKKNGIRYQQSKTVSSYPAALPLQQIRLKINDDIQTNTSLDSELHRLRGENERLQLRSQQLEKDLEFEQNETRERIYVNDPKREMHGELLLCVSTGQDIATNSTIDQTRQRWLEGLRDEISVFLDRVAVVWEMVANSPLNPQSQGDGELPVSVQETTLAIQEQIKVSLMLIELKIRNSLHLLESEASLENVQLEMNDELQQRLHQIQEVALNACKDIEQHSNEQIRNVKEQSIQESIKLRIMYTTDVTNFQELSHRQERLEGELARVQSTDGADTRQSNSGLVLVDQETLHLLNNEVDRVVEQIQEKNDAIDRLQNEIDEYKLRERTLNVELSRIAQEKTPSTVQETNEEEKITGQDDA